MSGEKTHQPTPRRLKEARDRGEVAISHEVTATAVLGAAVAVLWLALGWLQGSFESIVTTALEFARSDRSEPAMFVALGQMTLPFVAIVLIFAGVTAAAGMLAMAAQVGFQLSMEKVKPKLENISPVQGIRKIYSLRALLDLLRMVLRAGVTAVIMVMALRMAVPLMSSAAFQPLPRILELLGLLLQRLLLAALAVALCFAAMDYAVQRWSYIRRLRMSRQEIMQEIKNDQGDGHIKSERRKLARKLIFEDPAPAMQLASVLIVNPTHVAVALRYDPRENALPQIVAKGCDEAAARLRTLARQANVPIVGNPPVARALYALPDSEAVPEALFEVLAAILRWVDTARASQTVDPS